GRVPAAAAAARHPRLPALHPAVRAGSVDARRRCRHRAPGRHGLRSTAAPGPAQRRRCRELPGLRPTQRLMALAPLVLFDLDGTLVDTAPDLHAALNALLAGQGRAAVEAVAFRATVSRGGSA